MTKWKLKKDLPGIKAGAIFDDNHNNSLGIMGVFTYVGPAATIERTAMPQAFDSLPDWFEKVEESGRLKIYYRLNSQMQVVAGPDNGREKDRNCYEAGNYFETADQAKEVRQLILGVFKAIREHNRGECGCGRC